MPKIKEVVMEKLIEAIENYKYLVELNLGSKGYTLEHSIITQNLNEKIEKARESLSKTNDKQDFNITLNINAPVDVEKVMNELSEKLKQANSKAL